MNMVSFRLWTFYCNLLNTFTQTLFYFPGGNSREENCNTENNLFPFQCTDFIYLKPIPNLMDLFQCVCNSSIPFFGNTLLSVKIYQLKWGGINFSNLQSCHYTYCYSCSGYKFLYLRHFSKNMWYGMFLITVLYNIINFYNANCFALYYNINEVNAVLKEYQTIPYPYNQIMSCLLILWLAIHI